MVLVNETSSKTSFLIPVFADYTLMATGGQQLGDGSPEMIWNVQEGCIRCT